MKRGGFMQALTWNAAILAAGFAALLTAQTGGGLAFTSFDLGASPNPIGDGFSTTLTATVVGTADGAPNGQIYFYVSTNSITCSSFSPGSSPSIGSHQVGPGGVATVPYNANSAGTFPICAYYSPGDGDAYAAATAGVYLVTVNQPTVFSVNVPAAGLQGAPLTFTFGITSPSGQTPPTGTITLEDPGLGYAIIGTATVTNGVVSNSVTTTLAGTGYYAIYSGDGNYEQQTVSGYILIENGLDFITPSAINAGPPDTNFTLTGLGFNSNSQVQVLSSDGWVALSSSSVISSTQIQATIPASYLQNPGELSVEVITGAITGGPIQLEVYAPYTDSATVSATPSTFPYGTTVSSIFNATVTRGSASIDAAVPAGQVNYVLNGTNGNPYSAPVGTAQLSQVSSQGSYLSPFTETMDGFGTGKLVAADLNADGYVDVVGLPAFYYGFGAAAPYLQVMLSTGANAFQTEEQVYTGCEAQDFAVGDINNDTFPDLVVVCDSYGNSSGVSTLEAFYMLGNGDGTFQQPVAFGGNSFIGAATQVVLGQFNQDGYLDIAVIDGVNGDIQVISPFGNSGNPTYGPQVKFAGTIQAYGPVVSGGAADFNQDGYTDLVLENYSTNFQRGAITVFISEGNLNGFYVESQSSFNAGSYNMQSMAISDVNGDGYPDVAIADPGGADDDPGSYLVFENDGTGDGNLNYTTSEQVNSIGSIAGAPFPTIGKPSSTAAAAPGWNLVYTYIGNDNNLWVGEIQRISAGNWTTITSFDTYEGPYGTEGGSLPDFIVTGDMNGDGYLDFALNGLVYVGDSDNPQYQLQPWYYGNDAQASVTSSTLVPTPGNYTLNLTYPGNQLYQPNSNAVSPITIIPATPNGSLAGPSSAVTYGTNVTLTATLNGVSGGVAPTGTVSFYNGGIFFQSAGLNSDGEITATASITTAQLPDGLDAISVAYAGDGNYNQVNPFGTTNVQVNSTPISLVLTESTNSTTAGTMVTFQVQASGAILPVGQNVTLTGLPTAAAVVPTFNSAGLASYSYGLFPPGSYTIRALYAGNSSFQANSSNTVSLQVGLTPINVTLTSSANPVPYPTPINLTANATSNGLGIPTGTISFQNNGSQVGSGALITDNGSSGLLSVGNIDAISGHTVIAIVTGDFNGDHNQDMALLETGSGAASLLVSLGNGDGTFQAPVSYTSASFGYGAGVDPTSVAMAAADFNGDGYTDLVIAASDGYVVVLLSAGPSGALGLSQYFNMATPVAVATGDFNGDRHQDFAVITSDSVTAFYNDGTGNFSPEGSWTQSAESAEYTGITVADFNQDGYADIAVSDNSAPDVTVFLSSYQPDGGSLSFNSQMYPVGASATAIASGDVNGDGYPDLAVASNIDSTVAVLINNAAINGNSSKGTFGLPTSYGVALQPAAVAMSDFNKDGYADIAVTGTGTGQGGGTTILLGSSGGAMTGETSLPAIYGQAIASTDFNNDGNPDLAVGYNGVTVFLDSGAQASVSGVVLPAGTNPLTAVYTPTGDTSSFAGSTSNTLYEVVNQTASTIAWSNPAAIVYGTALSGTQLNAVASVPGTYVYTPALGTLLSAGTHQLSVSFVPTDTVDYLGSTATVSITVNQAGSTIAWSNPAAIPYGTALGGTQLNATPSVSGTLTYTPASGTVLTAGTHQLFVSFVPTDTLDYLSATASVSITVSQGASTVAWLSPAAIAYGTALSGTQLNATSSVTGTLTYTPAAGTVLTAGAHQLTVDFLPADSVDYQSATASVSITVNRVASTITWANPAAIAYGTALSGTQLNATASVPGTFTYTPALATVLTAGPHTLSVTFVPSDSVDYLGATATVSITVAQAASAVSWSNPAAISYGTPLSNTQLNATASVPGAFAYTPASGAILTAGSHTLSVTFTPTDMVDYSASTAGVSITVNQATPTITWAAPVAIPYGTALSATQLNATASTTGALTYTPASGTVLTAGLRTLNVSFTPTDSTDYSTATGSVSIQVNPAVPVITWANPVAISYGTPLSATQLNATATPAGGTFTYSPPPGTTLPVGTQTLSVKYVPTDTADYATASASATIQVIAGLALSSIDPTSGNYGAAATTIALTGTGFASNSVVQLNGTTIISSFLSPSQMTAVIPASFFEQTQPGAITVTNPTAGTTTPSVEFTVALPNVLITFNGPGSESPGQQPSLNLEFLQGYPLPVQVTLTITVQPATAGGPVDPAVQFSTGGTTLTFALPANSTTIPAIQIQTGTLAATITVTLTLESGGQDVTPSGLQPVVIVVPAVAPVISSATLTRSGDTLTVTIQGYSSTRDLSSAVFTFTPAAGATIDNPQVTVDVSSDFTSWYSQETSDQYGSAFSYTQIFNLSSDASTVGSVSVTLTNSVGTSNSESAN